MKIINFHITRGPNYWSIKKHKLVVMLLDIEELEHRPTDEIDGFYDRLKKILPTAGKHYCSEGIPGGFFKRVKRGTWMAHVVEHIALELQTLAGLDAGFGRTRGSGEGGKYYVVFDCSDAKSGRFTADVSVEIAQNLVDGLTPNIESAVKEIREKSLLNAPGPSTASILKEAKAQSIPVLKRDEASTYQLGYGCYQKTIAATITSDTNHLAVEKSCDKLACKQLFRSVGIPVPEGRPVHSRTQLSSVVDELGFPLVIKPVSGNQGRGITTNINSLCQAQEAYKAAVGVSSEVIVERHITGFDFRILMVNHKVVAAAKRTPPHVIGDGRSTINRLINVVNSDPQRGEGHENMLTKITISDSTKRLLRSQNCTLETVLPKSAFVYLHYAANLSKGGTAENVTEALHPEVVTVAEHASRMIDLDICGIDLIASSLSKPLSETGGKILEVNAAPGFRMHLSPSKGKPVNVAAPVIDMLFPEKNQARIPITAVTGTNGKTTTTRLIAHILSQADQKAGYTTTDGIYINGRQISDGDCGGPKSAEIVLRDSTVEVAVLECARGGILRQGLGFDQCDTGVVTNVTSDHLGLQGIDSLEKMARVKSVIPESVHSGGHAILNADDDLVYRMKKNILCRVILFSMNSANPRIAAHSQSGGTCVIYENKTITILDGGKSIPVESVKRIPLAFEGRAGFMIENILAATAAAYAQNISLKHIREALQNFKASPEQTPGRMNIFDFNDFDVMIDYAHNYAGLTGLKNFLDQSNYTQRTGIVAAIGDRREEDNRELGRLSAEIFDTLIIREDNDLRGKKPGELTEILQEGISHATANPKIVSIADEKEALRYAVDTACPGSIVILCTERIFEILAWVKELQKKHKSHKPSVMKKITLKRVHNPTKKMLKTS